MPIVLFLLIFTLSACSMDAQLTDLNPSLPPIEIMDQKDPDFYHAEVVTTSNGSVVKGVLGEISENQVLSNGAVIEGAFYE
jgi:hypothetical protein